MEKTTSLSEPLNEHVSIEDQDQRDLPAGGTSIPAGISTARGDVSISVGCGWGGREGRKGRGAEKFLKAMMTKICVHDHRARSPVGPCMNTHMMCMRAFAYAPTQYFSTKFVIHTEILTIADLLVAAVSRFIGPEPMSADTNIAEQPGFSLGMMT